MDFLYNFSAEDLIPQTHPLRKIKVMADEVLGKLDGALDKMYADAGRPSIPPEFLLKASLLISFYSIRSERQLCEQLSYNFLFRWFLDLMPNDSVPNHSTFAKNRERVLNQEIANSFLAEVVRFAQSKNLVSDEHFTADGTLIEAWASLKSFKPKQKEADVKREKPIDTSRNPTVNFHGEKHSNETHASTTDPESMLARKGLGKEGKVARRKICARPIAFCGLSRCPILWVFQHPASAALGFGRVGVVVHRNMQQIIVFHEKYLGKV